MPNVDLYSYKQDEIRAKIPKKHLTVVDPTSQRKDCKEFFGNNVQLWDDYYKKDGNNYKFNLSILKSVLARCNKKSLLDVGCGAGIPLIEFAKMGHDVTGFDFTETAVSITKQNIQEQNISAKIF